MMRNKLLCALLVFSLLVLQWNGSFAKAEEAILEDSIPAVSNYSAQKKERELLVTYKKGGAGLGRLPKGAKEEKLTDGCSLIKVEEEENFKAAMEDLAFDPDTLSVEPNVILTIQNTRDLYSAKQWAYYENESNINVEPAWKLGGGKNKKVTVAVIDTGIDYQHADLKDHMWINEDEVYKSSSDQDGNGYPGDYYGWNFLDDSPVICDYEYSKEEEVYADYHGTHIAGIIAAQKDNGVGIAGICGDANVSVMSVKVIDGEGNADLSKIIKAIRYAEKNGAAICNLSLGTAEYSKALYQVMEDSKMLFVCAAGNGDKEKKQTGFDVSKKPLYPAAFDLDNIISVANADSTGKLDESSCYSNKNVDIAAPGTKIVSTYVDPKHTANGTYVELSGTSMAAPFVSGAAALLLSYYGETPAEEIRERIIGGGKKMDKLAKKVVDGAYLDIGGAFLYPFMQSSKKGLDIWKAEG